jgi:hypothetical protein
VQWATANAAVLAAVQRCASPSYPTGLVDGNVTWIGRDEPFISDATQAGIYLQWTNWMPKGRAGTHKSGVVAGLLTAARERQTVGILQVTAKSLEDTDTTSAFGWLANLVNNLGDPEEVDLLHEAGVSLIEVGEAKSLEGVLDDRSASVAVLSIRCQLLDSVVARPVPYIEHVRGTATVSRTNPTSPTDHEWQAGEDSPYPIYYGVGAAGLTSVSTLTGLDQNDLDGTLPKVYPADQKLYFVHRADMGNAAVTLDGFDFDGLAERVIWVGSVAYTCHESTQLFSWPTGLTFVTSEVHL